MALGDSYATLSEFKDYISLNDDDLIDDLKLSDALASASREIEKFTGRQFNNTATATPRLYRPKRRNLVSIDDFHTIDDLVIQTGYAGSFSTTWTDSDYQLEPLNGIVDGELGWPFYKIRAVGNQCFDSCSARATLQVTAQWGWSEVPSLVKQACLIIASETFKIKDAPFGVQGYGEFGPVRVKDSPIAKRMLGPYRLNPVKVG
jgi:hypothetical protein